MKRPRGKSSPPARPRRTLIELDADIRQALEMLGRDQMQDLKELAEKAYRDLLKKHRRFVTLKEQLRQSSQAPANDEA